jgi:hypothetical protein
MLEDDIGPYKRHELLTGKIYYPALGYSGYGDGKSTHIADFVTHEMRLDWLANRDRLLAFWKSGEPISKFFPDSKPWLLDRGGDGGCSTIRIKRRSNEKFARNDKPLAPLEGVFTLTWRIRRGVDGGLHLARKSRHQDEWDSTEPALDLAVGGHLWI